MALGGVVAVFDKRYARQRRKRSVADSDVVAA